MRTRRALLFVAFLVLFACTADTSAAPTLSVADLARQMQTSNAPLVVDVRSAEEFATGHIPGARNIPFQEIGGRMDELDSPTGVALYCMVGPRARKAEDALVAAGFDAPIQHIDGGLGAWKAAGLAVEAER